MGTIIVQLKCGVQIKQTNSIVVMNVSGSYFSLVVDINNGLYCCIANEHQVEKRSLNSNGSLVLTIVAGNGTSN